MANSSYEPDWFSKPGDTLADLMSRERMSCRELADRLQEHAETVIGLLQGKVAINESLAGRLTEVVGGSPSFWLKRQVSYDVALSRAANNISGAAAEAWLKEFPAKALAECGLTRRGTDRHEILKSFLAYFGVTGPEDWASRYASFSNDVAFRSSTTFETQKGALAVWLRRGELEAAKVSTAKWNPRELRQAIPDLRRLSRRKSPLDFVPRLRLICASLGVAVVFVRAPQGCRASGASRFVSADKAMIVVSFRHRSDDHFWFTFFHEIAHLLLHGQENTFIDQDEGTDSERESEANAFAAMALVPPQRHDELISLAPKIQPVVRFAMSVGVAPGVVVGQMQHLGVIGRDKLNFLKRRYDWDDLAAAFA